jgi:hypothetical protein
MHDAKVGGLKESLMNLFSGENISTNCYNNIYHIFKKTFDKTVFSAII